MHEKNNFSQKKKWALKSFEIRDKLTTIDSRANVESRAMEVILFLL